MRSGAERVFLLLLLRLWRADKDRLLGVLRLRDCVRCLDDDTVTLREPDDRDEERPATGSDGAGDLGADAASARAIAVLSMAA